MKLLCQTIPERPPIPKQRQVAPLCVLSIISWPEDYPIVGLGIVWMGFTLLRNPSKSVDIHFFLVSRHLPDITDSHLIVHRCLSRLVEYCAFCTNVFLIISLKISVLVPEQWFWIWDWCIAHRATKPNVDFLYTFIFGALCATKRLECTLQRLFCYCRILM